MNNKLIRALREAGSTLVEDLSTTTEVAARLLEADCVQSGFGWIALTCPLALWYRRALLEAGLLEDGMIVQVVSSEVRVWPSEQVAREAARLAYADADPRILARAPIQGLVAEFRSAFDRGQFNQLRDFSQGGS